MRVTPRLKRVKPFLGRLSLSLCTRSFLSRVRLVAGES